MCLSCIFKEYSEFSIQTKIDKNDLAERMEKLKQDLQTKQVNKGIFGLNVYMYLSFSPFN